MTDEAKAAKAAYMKEWRKKNKDTIRDYHKLWCKNNPEKVATHQRRYWQKQAEKQHAE